MDATTAGPPRRWRGQTHGDRAEQRRRRLMAAGYELLGDEGAAGVAMRAVCRRAGLSPRYFYESFPDTDALTIAVYDACNADLATAIADAATGRPGTDTAVAAAVDAAATYFQTDPRRVRILLREPLSNPVLGAHRADILPGLLSRLVAQSGLGGAREPSTVAALDATALSGALAALVLDWTDGRLAVGRDELVGYATNLVLSGLTHRPAPGG